MVETPRCHRCKTTEAGLFVKEDRWWCANCMYAELTTLRDIVGKLPKTADGVPVVPGMTVYHRDYLGVVTEDAGEWESPFPNLLRCCYSTEATARVAGESDDT